MNAADTYQGTCVRYHGARDEGREPAAPGDPRTRNFTDTGWQRTLSDEDIAAVVREGKGAMPAFGEALTDPEVRAAVVAIRGFAGEAR